MLSRFGGGVKAQSVWGWSGTDTVATTELNCPFSHNPWGLNNGQRTFTMPKPTGTTLFQVVVSTNNNTMDGAHVDCLVDLALPGNETVIIDQATGTFQDITNSDVTALDGNFSYQYIMFDGTALIRNCANVVI